MSSDPADIVNQTIAELMPGFRSAKRRVLLTLLLIALIPVALFILIPADKDQFLYPLAVLAFTAMPLVVVPGQIRRAHERALLPVLARAVGLSHQKDESGMPSGTFSLLKQGEFSADDVFTGQIGAKAFTFAEIRGALVFGDRPSGIFNGVVMSIPVTSKLPDFRLAAAPTDKEPPSHPPHDLILRSDRREYLLFPLGVTAASPPAFESFLKSLVALGNNFPPFGELAAAEVAQGQLRVALSCPGEFFRLTGLFPGEDQLTLDLKAAMADLRLPFRLAEALIEAEATFVQNARSLDTSGTEKSSPDA